MKFVCYKIVSCILFYIVFNLFLFDIFTEWLILIIDMYILLMVYKFDLYRFIRKLLDIINCLSPSYK